MQNEEGLIPVHLFYFQQGEGESEAPTPIQYNNIINQVIMENTILNVNMNLTFSANIFNKMTELSSLPITAS